MRRTAALLTVLAIGFVVVIPAVKSQGPAYFGAIFDPDFFWLPPTVPTLPVPTGPFDAAALDTLVVRVCELNPSGVCRPGPAVEEFTSSGNPVPTRIKVNPAGEFYRRLADWDELRQP